MESNKDLILREKLALQRTVMANQTTLLSFIRTSLYFLVAGLSLKNLIKVENSLIIEIVFFIMSFIIIVIGLYNYNKQRLIIKKSRKKIGNYINDFLND